MASKRNSCHNQDCLGDYTKKIFRCLVEFKHIPSETKDRILYFQQRKSNKEKKSQLNQYNLGIYLRTLVKNKVSTQKISVFLGDVDTKWKQIIKTDNDEAFQKRARMSEDALSELLCKLSEYLDYDGGLEELIVRILKHCKAESYIIPELEKYSDEVDTLISSYVDVTSEDEKNTVKEKTDTEKEDIRGVVEDISLSSAQLKKNVEINQPSSNGLCISFEKGTSEKRFKLSIDQCRTTNKLVRPFEPEYQSLDNISSILSWRTSLTNIIGRDKELEQLESWVYSDFPKSISYIHGKAGVGKTRLAFHLAEKITDDNWEAGETAGNLYGQWVAGKRGILIIIDSPEKNHEASLELVAAVRDMPDLPFRVRVLFITRSYDYVKKLEVEAPVIFTEGIKISPLDNRDDNWVLFLEAIERIQKFSSKINVKSSIANTKNELEFYKWIESDSGNQTPLMIIAFALYIVKKKHKSIQPLLGLEASAIFSYFSSQEIAKIEKEVENYNTINSFSLNQRLVSLILSLSKLRNGFSAKSLSEISKSYYSLDNSLAPIDYIRLKGLSIWSKSGIKPLAPDLYNSFFLYYCITKFTFGDEAKWIFYTAGLEKTPDSKDKSEEAIQILRTLSTAIYDVNHTLKKEWIITDELKSYLQDNNDICLWISETLPELGLDSTLIDITAHALLTLAAKKSSPEEEAKLRLALSRLIFNQDRKAAHEQALLSMRTLKRHLKSDNKFILLQVKSLIQCARTADSSKGLEYSQQAMEILFYLSEHEKDPIAETPKRLEGVLEATSTSARKLYEQGDFYRSKLLLEQCLLCRQQLIDAGLPFGDKDYISEFNLYSEILYAFGETEKAIYFSVNTLNIVKKNYKIENLENIEIYVDTINNCAKIQLFNNNPDEALCYMDELSTKLMDFKKFGFINKYLIYHLIAALSQKASIELSLSRIEESKDTVHDLIKEVNIFGVANLVKINKAVISSFDFLYINFYEADQIGLCRKIEELISVLQKQFCNTSYRNLSDPFSRTQRDKCVDLIGQGQFDMVHIELEDLYRSLHRKVKSDFERHSAMLASICTLLSENCRKLNRNTESLEYCKEAVALFKLITRKGQTYVTSDYALSLQILAMHYHIAMLRPKLALSNYNRSIALWKELAKESSKYLESLALCLLNKYKIIRDTNATNETGLDLKLYLQLVENSDDTLSDNILSSIKPFRDILKSLPVIA